MKQLFKYKKIILFFSQHGKLIALGILCVILLSGVINMFDRYQLVTEKKARADRDFITLSEKEKNIRTEVSRLNTPEGVEEGLRESFRVAKPGEYLIVILPKEEKTEVVSENTVQKIRSFFKNIFSKKKE